MNISGDDFYALISDMLQRRGAETLQRTLYRGLREAILNGRLLAESRLPGSRIIAEQLGISRNTVNAALEQLTLEGFLHRNRQGTRVAHVGHRDSVQPAQVLEVKLAQRSRGSLRRHLAPCPFLHSRPEPPRFTIFHYRCGDVYTIAFYEKKVARC